MKKALPIILLASAICFSACRTVRVVEHVHTTDSSASSHKEREVIHDTTIIERNTIIREADSALRAQLKAMGIKVSEYERMLVIMQQQLTNQTHNQQNQSIDTTTHIREVEKPVPVEVQVEVEKPLSWWQKTLMWSGAIAILAALGLIVWKTKKWWIKLI